VKTQLSRSTALRPASLLALCSALLLAALLALPSPAQAHDTLLSSDPADGATLETSPEEIGFTFSADVLDVSPLVRITDESGTELTEIVPTVDGPVVTATLTEPLPAGTHTIQWRVVSSDGHPIEGTQTLTIEQGADEGAGAEDAAAESSDGGGEAAGDTSDAGGAEQPSESEQGQTSAAQDGDADTDQDGGLSMPVLLGILAVVVVGAAAAVFAIMRRRD
jgi:methionine-rich copper-binding protein CopC